MSYYPGHGYGHSVDDLIGSFGRMGIDERGAYGYPMAPVMPRIRFSAFNKDGIETPLDTNLLIHMLKTRPSTVHNIIGIYDFPNGDTIELNILFNHDKKYSKLSFNIIAMYHYNPINAPYHIGPDGVVVKMPDGSPSRIDSAFIKLPGGPLYDINFVFNILYTLFGIQLSSAPRVIYGLLDDIIARRVGGGNGKRRGRSMTRKGKGKRKSTRRRG